MGASLNRFFCGAHQEPGDTPIAGELVYRRVHLTVEVFLGGTGDGWREAQVEAFNALYREVRRLGGVLGIVGVLSQVGQGTFAPAVRKHVAKERRAEPA